MLIVSLEKCVTQSADSIISPCTPVDKCNLTDIHSYFINLFPARRKWLVFTDNLGKVNGVHAFDNKYLLGFWISIDFLFLFLDLSLANIAAKTQKIIRYPFIIS